MSGLLDHIARSSRTRNLTRSLALSLVFVAVPTGFVRAQGFGYGYGFPGYGYGMSGFGYGGMGYGYGGTGYGGFGYPGVGLGYGGNFGYSGFGYGVGMAYGGAGVSVGSPGPYGYWVPYGSPGPGVLNPYFGVGLTPLGVNSALTERYLLGRGTTRYSSSYGPAQPSYAPSAFPATSAVPSTIVTVPAAGAVAPGTTITRP